MGQYWLPVNLDKREYIMPHKLGAGLKLWEQIASHPGTGAALIVLCAAQRETRGGGDLDMEKNWHGSERVFPDHNITPGPMPTDYSDIAGAVIGRWAGDRIALVGDYAEGEDLAPEHQAHLIYHLCTNEESRRDQVKHLRSLAEKAREAGGRLYGESAEDYESEAGALEHAQLYTDITPLVARVIEHELSGEFSGEGWKDWKEVEV